MRGFGWRCREAERNRRLDPSGVGRRQWFAMKAWGAPAGERDLRLRQEAAVVDANTRAILELLNTPYVPHDPLGPVAG